MRSQSQTGALAETAGSQSLSKSTIVTFIVLQALDLITTIAGFNVGASEGSHFVRILMHAGPVTGVVLSKVFGLGLGGLALYNEKHRLLEFVNYWYGALVIWNLVVILTAAGAR
jgi:hypothetical protein